MTNWEVTQVPSPVRVIAGIKTPADIPLTELTSGQEFVIRGKGFQIEIGSVGLNIPSSAEIIRCPRVISWSDERVQAICPDFTNDVPEATLLLAGPVVFAESMPKWLLLFPSVRVRAEQVTRPSTAKIRAYWAIREESIRQIASGREFAITCDGLPPLITVAVFWGNKPVELLQRPAPNRLHVRAPKVDTMQTAEITVIIKGTGETVVGQPLSVFPVSQNMSLSFGTPLAGE